ncbi:flagellar hook-length control protein FliK [Cypionkella psychrotolerans]|uniref:flagellar hook-length control protein FliK n=1 Tax=Cypionkella psychrotolerans TaxID=1678131 RepID=UPI0012E1EDCD|nr:flagellar hook-length control protein FliK [Cypionkella psychrotolerans]
MTPKPTADAAVPPNPPAALPDQTTLQPTPDQVNQQTNPASAQPIPPHQTVQTQALPPALATTVPAQLLHHTTAAKTDGVDVLLQPEELGHVKFQIQQHGETVRILLSAERPETLDLLRRHSDQLLQEFRQSGFSQASLNFGQWGQQQRSPTPPPELVASFDADFVEPHPTPRPTSTAAAAPSGQGLDLRL